MTVARFGSGALLAVLWLLAGHASARADDVRASGNVALNGKPLAEGKVTFHLDNGQFVGSKVKDGKYLVDRLPVGTHKVTVEGQGVHAKYGSEATTPLQVKIVEKGEFHFDLK
jgi:hypothetical protein